MEPRIKTSRRTFEAVVFVTLDGEDETRVRFKRAHRGLSRPQWRCDQCGPHMFATCAHERVAVAAYRDLRNND